MAQPTLRDVAELVGMSKSTVSRVLSGRHPTSPEAQAKVLAACNQLGYTPNAQARALAGTGSTAIGYVVTTLAAESLAQICQGIQEQVGEQSRLCLSTVAPTVAMRERAVATMREQRVACVIFVGRPDVDDPVDFARQIQLLSESGIRAISVAGPELPEGSDAVVLDYDARGGSYAAASHLLTYGHRRILFLGTAGHHLARRAEGHRDALADAQVELDLGLIEPIDATEAMRPGTLGRGGGQRLIFEHLDRVGQDFTAVQAANDSMAVGAIGALRMRGLRVPDDVSVVGFYDLPFASDFGLTTVNVPHLEMGRAAARAALQDPAATQWDPSGSSRTYGAHLVVRDSVQRARSASVTP